MQEGLKPIYNQKTKLLILGSAPSVQSLQKQQYYGNKGNRFWSIIFKILQVPDPQDYDKRLRILLENNIGLWDVYQKFDRKGSMDHQYKASQLNDFDNILKQSDISIILANGKTAANEINNHQLFTKLTVYSCLSTSGANNSRHQARYQEWAAALQSLKTK